MQTNNKMAVAPVGKLIWQMSLPPLISMFLQYSYNLIDSAFVARLSENALTAVSLSFPITTLMNAASIWIGVGVNVLIAGYLGERKQDEANITVTHGLLLAFGIGALLNLLSLLIMKPYFGAFTNNEEIYQLSIRRIIRDCNDEQFLHSDEPDVLLPHFSCHSLRHTFTTRMCEAGVNIKVIQEALGHSDISTTLNIYADVTKEMKAEEFKGLDSYFKV